MSDTEAALLRAIAAHPDEDTPRLVFADYLDELGTPDAAGRAEFVRLQVRAAPLPMYGPERVPLERRIEQLLWAWDLAWRRQIPDGVELLSGYRRGFPYRGAARASAVLALGDDPRLPPLDSLILTADVNASGLRELVRRPLVAGLKQLVVRSDVPIGWSGARALAGGEYPRLEQLNLARQAIGDVGLRALCESLGLLRVRELDLSENNITDAGADLLLDSALLRRLRRLLISRNALDERSHARLGAATQLY